MKRTKKAKSITVEWENYISIMIKYKCPVCGIKFHGFVNKGTTRFLCDCGQELIIKNRPGSK